MKYIILFLFLIFGSLFLQAQDDNRDQRKGRFRISPNIAYNHDLIPKAESEDRLLLREIPENGRFLILRREISAMNSPFLGENLYGYFLEFDQVNYVIGAGFEYFLFDRASLKSGINYSNRDFSASPALIVDSYIAGRPVFGEKIFFKSRYIETPLLFRLYSKPKRINFFVELGLSAEVNIVSKGDFTPVIWNFGMGDEVINTGKLASNRFVLNGKAGLGTSYELNSVNGFQISVNYTLGITNSYPGIDVSDLQGLKDDLKIKAGLKANYLEAKLSYYITF